MCLVTRKWILLGNLCPNNQRYELQVQSIAEAALAEQNEMISGRQKARGAQNGRYGGVGGVPGEYYTNISIIILIILIANYLY